MDRWTDKASYRSACPLLKITEKNGKNGGGKEKSPKIGGDWKPESLPTLIGPFIRHLDEFILDTEDNTFVVEKTCMKQSCNMQMRKNAKVLLRILSCIYKAAESSWYKDSAGKISNLAGIWICTHRLRKLKILVFTLLLSVYPMGTCRHTTRNGHAPSLHRSEA